VLLLRCRCSAIVVCMMQSVLLLEACAMAFHATSSKPRSLPAAGSCGRCYEVRCKEGYVLGWEDKPVPYEGNFYYFPQHASAPDTQGRAFPGNPAEKEGLVYVKCWDNKKSVRVRIIDICPCYYCPETGG
jgi:hypothetical protein